MIHIFFFGSKPSPDVPLRFVYFEDLLDFLIELGVHIFQSFRDVFMYG